MAEKYFSIAIDGPSGAGKSTLAKRIAKELGFTYVDTGAIYRTVGYHMWLHGIGPKDVDGVTRLLDDVNIEIRHEPDGQQHMILNGKDVTGEIRTPEMSYYASGVSSLPVVRAFLMDMQRDFAKKDNVIMDGRDIGTVVLPNADVKIFLTASAEERARRRYVELVEKGQPVTQQQILEDMKKRDHQDSTRTAAPLKPAEDSIFIDSTALSFDQTAEKILSIIRSKRV